MKLQSGNKVKIVQKRSHNKRDHRFKDTLACLGLGKIGSETTHTLNPALIGMLRRVSCIVEIEKA